ncbi:fas-binding factor 1 homolog [Lampris incognitus]|uniref:fas-binding factor 1 homolog n=1 Tax=Lampris incognitus TaxID=2546036 RepID=UPI0024B5768E|nr:fas-binding factor 1 homolog [Lampris incognitus]
MNLISITAWFFKDSFVDDDLLDDLLRDNEYLASGKPTRGEVIKNSSFNDDFFQKLAEEAERDGSNVVDSDVSEADPDDILKKMKDMDDLDAALFGSKRKPSSAPPQTKPFDSSGAKKDPPKSETNVKPRETDEPILEGKKPNSAPSSTAHGYKKFTFSDLDDPLANVLDDLLPEETKKEPKASIQKTQPEKSGLSPSMFPIQKKKETGPKKKEELIFNDDEGDLMDALGFDSEKEPSKKKETTLHQDRESSEPKQRARTRLDEILERGTSPRLLERPPTGERKNQSQPPEKPQQEKISSAKEEDFTFLSYQPTLVSTPEGRQSGKQTVRFSTEDISSSTPERKPKPSTPTTPTTSTRSRTSADWLGLKTNNDYNYQDEDIKEPKSEPETSKIPTSPVVERRRSLSGSCATPAKTKVETSATTSANPPKTEVAESQKKEEEEDDWLTGALSRKKALAASNSDTRRSKQEDSLGLGDEVDLDSLLSKQVSSSLIKGREEDTFTAIKEPGETSQRQPRPTAQFTPVRDKPKQVPQQNQMQNIAPAGQQQLTISSDSLQQLLLQQQLIQSQLLGQGGPLDAGSLPRWKEREQKYEDHQALQARIIQLDGQVKTLHLERDQSQMLLESIQQRHKQDMELMENTHKARVKMLEESAAQREAQARRECEDLIERLATVTQQAEQQRSELQAQHQRRLAQVQQDRDREVERLRDLQRKSILEMKKDHEDQVQRLKRLKDDEIDAVTSATSQTRSLTVVIEQMEQFSQRLGDLSSRVESTHEHTAQGLEQGARQRDEQLRVMQNRLDQQQRAMTEERARLKEVITRMDTQLAEQQRQLEKERWKVAAEQAKAESAQRSLEEERRSLTMHINMEREELERAKSALLEEQQSVMQHCAEERRKLAAEWSQFHSQEKQRLEMAEREASRAMERDAHRQNSIISMAQEQADLKLRAGELKQKDEAVAHERETLAREKEELEREKGRLSSTALKLKTRAQEVEAFSKLASEKYEEGEQALQEARHVESEHQARLRTIHSQIERLRQQEHHLHQERIRVTDIQKETERLRQGFPITPLPHVPLIPAQNFVLSNPEMAYIPNAPPPTLISSPGSVELQARLALLKHTAEKVSRNHYSLITSHIDVVAFYIIILSSVRTGTIYRTSNSSWIL